jgi:hypothetical protein
LPETYSYDAEGNRLVSHLSATHQTDGGNRLLQDDQFDYAQDDSGNLATKADRVTLAVTSYSYASPITPPASPSRPVSPNRTRRRG